MIVRYNNIDITNKLQKQPELVFMDIVRTRIDQELNEIKEPWGNVMTQSSFMFSLAVEA